MKDSLMNTATGKKLAEKGRVFSGGGSILFSGIAQTIGWNRLWAGAREHRKDMRMERIRYNCSIVFSPDGTRILMCRRMKDPFIGKLNLVGGRREEGESALDGAYRELYEETGITREDICLRPLMELDYPFLGYDLEIFFGFLKEERKLTEEVNPLIWVSADDDFADMERYAGAGNITHMVNIIRMYRRELEEYAERDNESHLL